VQTDPAIASTAEYLGRSQRPCVRLGLALEGDLVALDHDENDEVICRDAPNHLTSSRAEPPRKLALARFWRAWSSGSDDFSA